MKEIPIACSLGSDGMRTRRDEWRSLLAPNLVDRSVIEGGVRLVLTRSSNAKAELERLIALESSCCAWIDWTVREDALIEVDATAEKDEGVALLRQWFGPKESVGTR